MSMEKETSMEIVKIISKEMVKPSSPTPHHLQTYRFSLLDQIALPNFYPAVLYFLPEQDSNPSRKIHILKESLSSNLTRFYPFGGIIKDDLSLECNDEGIPFSIAQVRLNLQDFLTQPDLAMITKFIPIDYPSRAPSPGDHVSMIQVNCFECGGLAISIVVAHAVADGKTLATFLRGWAAVARSNGVEIRPKFIGQSLFQAINEMESKSKLFSCFYVNLGRFGKCATRRYLFDASVINKLKERAKSLDASGIAKPTSVEVVSAFIWKCFTKLFADKSNLGEPFVLYHQVNMRRKADPVLPDESFGNFIWMAATKRIINPADVNFGDLVSEVNRAIRKIDNEFVKVIQNNGYYESFEEMSKGFTKGAIPLTFTSWCKFGLYDVDFGWGKPIWLSGHITGYSEKSLSDVVLLMDTRSGDGIEAWVILDEKKVAAFEENEDLRNHVLINPSALELGKMI